MNAERVIREIALFTFTLIACFTIANPEQDMSGILHHYQHYARRSFGWQTVFLWLDGI